MTTYTASDFDNMAAAVGCEPDKLIIHKTTFELAARWYSSDRRRPRRTPPAKMRDKMDQIAKSANRLLKHLGIERPEDAFDGSGDREILAVLAGSADWSEDAVTNATRRIGRLTEILQAVQAAHDLGLRAREATGEVIEYGKKTVTPGHSGNDAVNDWLAVMMEIYQNVTGNEPATSVNKPGQPNEGIASGPLIRFLQTAAKPLKIECDEDALRSRLRTILNLA